MSKKIKNNKWLVVEVRSGIPISVKVFKNLEMAERYSEEVRKTMNLEDDETGIFPVEL